MKIYAAKVCEIPKGLCERLFPLLDRRRLEKVTAIKQEQERLRSIHAGLLLRHVFLAEGFSTEMWQRIEVVEGSHGKPYLSNCGDFFLFSFPFGEMGALCSG